MHYLVDVSLQQLLHLQQLGVDSTNLYATNKTTIESAQRLITPSR